LSQHHAGRFIGSSFAGFGIDDARRHAGHHAAHRTGAFAELRLGVDTWSPVDAAG
jgi:hypothetical protein